MKCEVLCSKCATTSREMFAPEIVEREYPGEYVLHVAGTLRGETPAGDDECVCDSCNVWLAAGAAVTCRSIGVLGDYRPWELNYVEPEARTRRGLSTQPIRLESEEM